jgi:glutamyl-tRNA synthetase
LAEKEPSVVRFKVPKTGTTEFVDLVRGKVSFDNKILDDQIILKSDGFPTYHLASVIDDHDMAVTHVIRGEEWLPSTPKHLLLYKAFGWEAPQFAHLPLLLNPDRSKLSKRQGDVSCEDYLSHGYLPEALLNFILLLGWNPGTDQEIFSLDEMVTTFSLEHINKSGAVFNTQKLDWLNGHYIKQLSVSELAKRSKPFFDAAGITIDEKTIEKIVATEQQRIKRLDEIVEATKFFFELPTYEPSLLLWKKNSAKDTIGNLTLSQKKLQALSDWDTATIEQTLKTLVMEHSLDNGSVLWPIRAALSGKKASPGPFEIAAALGKEETLKRLDFAIQLLGKT